MNWSEYCGGKPLKVFSFNNVIIFNDGENEFDETKSRNSRS